MQLIHDLRFRLTNQSFRMIKFQDLLNFHASPAGAFEVAIVSRFSRTPRDFTNNLKEGCLKMVSYGDKL